MKKAAKFFNRELSWIEFNKRVLAQAEAIDVPLLERLKFLAITAGNLDEFFMVRIGGLQTLVANSIASRDPSGLTPNKQLTKVLSSVREHMAEQYRVFAELEDHLASEGIVRLGQDSDAVEDLSAGQIFEKDIFPVLSPIAIGGNDDSPLIAGRLMHCCVRLQTAGANKAFRWAVIPLPRPLSRFVNVSSSDCLQYILLEDLVARNAASFFQNEKVVEVVPFRISRNADMIVREDLAADLLTSMEAVIDARKRSDCVRLEIAATASRETRRFLAELSGAGESEIFDVAGPLDLSAFMQLRDARGFDHLRYETRLPIVPASIPTTADIFAILDKRNVVLHHPYDSFEPVVRFVEQAADNPDVIAIKQILYRTSRRSPIVAALKRAAENGKYVTVLVELKARFDEERNIGWARELEDSGVQVIYGVKGFKTHAKLCLVVKRTENGVKRYIHAGTGNYNEITAQLYTDVSFLTASEDLAADASAFFNVITARTEPVNFRRISMSPLNLREKILESIETEIERSKQGHRARIVAKMNSLVDPMIIEALYRASAAGVETKLIVRGICCLVPGQSGLSENISVISVVDRLLEHSRVFMFLNGGDTRIFISSADWMPRNLDKRLELLVPIEDKQAIAKLSATLETVLDDNSSSWTLNPDGSYTRRSLSGKEKPHRCQETFFRAAVVEENRAKKLKRTIFEPHRKDTV